MVLSAAPETTNLAGVMGVSDWEFLCPVAWRDSPAHQSSGEAESGKRPSLDDFDGELAVFQVGRDVWF